MNVIITLLFISIIIDNKWKQFGPVQWYPRLNKDINIPADLNFHRLGGDIWSHEVWPGGSFFSQCLQNKTHKLQPDKEADKVYVVNVCTVEPWKSTLCNRNTIHSDNCGK